MLRVCVLGLGYVGLPTAALLAGAGHQVLGVDIDGKVLHGVNNGLTHVLEPGVAELLRQVRSEGRFTAMDKPEPSQVFVIAVPTPVTESKHADLTAVEAATRSLLPVLAAGNLVVVESTTPPFTLERVVKPILEESGLRVGTDLYLAYCPERVMPGNALHEIVHNDRVVGGCTPICADKAREFYASFTRGAIHLTGGRQAELTKLIENAYRDVNIAFANEIAGLCEAAEVCPQEVIALANCHPRVKVLNPGPGVGGHCIAVDPWFLIERFPDRTPLMTAARQVNDHRPEQVMQRVAELVHDIPSPIVAVLGLTYKANVNDVRESPALYISQELARRGFTVRSADPHVGTAWTAEQACHGADVLLLLVDHAEFRRLDLTALQSRMRHPHVVDTRGLWTRALAPV